jgi:hypothetical protein
MTTRYCCLVESDDAYEDPFIHAVASSLSGSPSTFERKSKGTWWGRIWDTFATQRTAGHLTIFNLAFSISIFCLMSIAFLVGGCILLTISLRQVQIKATYSDVGKLANLTNKERSIVLQGGSTPSFLVLLHLAVHAFNSVQLERPAWTQHKAARTMAMLRHFCKQCIMWVHKACTHL